MVLPAAEVYLEGLVEIAANKGLKTLALINEDTIFQYLEGFIDMATRKGLKTMALFHPEAIAGRAIAEGAIELAKRKGLEIVFVEAHPMGTTDFSALLARVRAANPDAVAAASYFEEAVAITRQMWQDGKKVIVWPEELAQRKPRFPTPPWRQRP